jgi:cold shock CspA family protein
LSDGPGSCTIAQVRDLDVRRPDLKDQTRSGTVRWFDEERGFGRITADDGEVLFVHFSAIGERNGFGSLHQGQRVTFRWKGATQDHGRHTAEEVRVICEQQPNRHHETASGLIVEGGVTIERTPPSD